MLPNLVCVPVMFWHVSTAKFGCRRLPFDTCHTSIFCNVWYYTKLTIHMSYLASDVSRTGLYTCGSGHIWFLTCPIWQVSYSKILTTHLSCFFTCRTVWKWWNTCHILTRTTLYKIDLHMCQTLAWCYTENYCTRVQFSHVSYCLRFRVQLSKLTRVVVYQFWLCRGPNLYVSYCTN